MLPQNIWEKIEAVFFDAEGTLFHITPPVGYIYAEICREYGLLVDASELQKTFLKVYLSLRGNWKASPESCFEGWREVFLKTISFFGKLKDPEAAYLKGYECFANPKYFRLSPDTEETLSALKASGRRLAILSNWDERLIRLIKAFGLEHLFEDILVSCEAGFMKPEPEIFHLACERLKISPNRALMIGDSLSDDVLGARAAGLWALRYPGGSLKKFFPQEIFLS
ncbi:HAD-superfamily hydrolase, subfamily IA, variant 1 [Thermodesulfatator indicus DSM 15286]|uniref:HAD-superfamily hydrolase, subfamily IA, variant 1 n=2 Tax=Thermodesulfatator indicus TaxID=171695 RepID=F8A8R3_THEID|nr:HAD-superfamily hydrolase, subfamily IA, variant 1 [Thermodesulfatator indicus DSM 15286]